MTAQLELSLKPFIELQIEALVGDNSIKPERVNKFAKELESRFVSLKNLDTEKLLKAPHRLPLIGRPNSLTSDYPEHLKFHAPEKLDIVGGFKTSTALKRTNYVDLAIRMPDGCLEKKDIKNQRYQHKRALYLTRLAHLLSSRVGSGLVDKLEFRYHQGDFLKPVLLITPKDIKLRKKIIFQLFIYPSETIFKVSMLHPSRGNVAPKWFFQDYPLNEAESDVQEFLEGNSDGSISPFYNSSILFDIEMVSNSNILQEQIGEQASIADALMITKIWLYQRELHHHFSFIVSTFVAYLQTKQVIHQNMSSYQIFKMIIRSLSSSDWTDSGISYYDDFKEKISTFKNYFPVIFLSPSGNLNLCYNISKDLYLRLKHEAQLSFDILSANLVDTFELLFLKKLCFINKFDVILHLPKCTKKLPLKLDHLRKFLDHGVFIPRVYSEAILNSIERALSDRVTLVQQSSDHLLLDKKWSIKSIPYDPSNEDNTFTVGLLLQPEKALRIIDVGPQAQTPEADDFRQFWDPKCQLRLQNGVISETVVWHVDNFSSRRAIIKYILIHALKRIDIHNIVVHYTLLERFISLNNVYFQWNDSSSSQVSENDEPKKRKREEIKIPTGTGEEIFQRVLRSYNELNKVVRSIEGLKHQISGIQPLSQHLRGTAVFPPLPVCLQQRNEALKRRKGVTLFPSDFSETGKILTVEPIEILLSLESSGKWPSEAEAYKAAQLDYLIDLGQALKEKEYTVKFSSDCLDVLHGQFVFRLRIKCPKQLFMATSTKTTQRNRLELEVLPRIHSALDQLYREHPAFGLTCRLVKRWLSCHLMTDHVSDIALDLIVAHLFLHPQPYSAPSSSACGFRRFLMLVAQHDWGQNPLVVNFDDQLKSDEITHLKDLMNEDRSKYPPIVIYTPYDKEISPFTRPHPSLSQLDLLCRISAKAFEFFNQDIFCSFDTLDKCKALFRPNFKLFNILIKLNTHVVQNFFMSIDPPKGFKLCGKEPNGRYASAFKVMPIVDLNVVEQYVQLLRSKFDQYALFFYDRYGQRVIGVILKPESEKALGGDLRKFIGDMRSLGSKLVDSITVNKQV